MQKRGRFPDCVRLQVSQLVRMSYLLYEKENETPQWTSKSFSQKWHRVMRPTLGFATAE